MATATETRETAPPQAPQYISVKRGQFIQLQTAPVEYPDGKRGYTQTWFKCSDVNIALHRDLSAIGVALDDFNYEVGKGAANDQVKTFKLRQFWQDPERNQVAYSWEGLAKWLADLGLRLDKSVPNTIGPVIRAGIKEFEKHYKGDILRDV